MGSSHHDDRFLSRIEMSTSRCWGPWLDQVTRATPDSTDMGVFRSSWAWQWYRCFWYPANCRWVIGTGGGKGQASGLTQGRGRQMSEGSPEETDASGGTESTSVSTTDTSGAKIRLWKRLKSVFGNNWVIGVATGLISGIVVAFYLSATGQAALTAVRNRLARPSCSDPQWLLQVPDSNVFASAYYLQFDHLEGYSSFHSASNTVDGDLNTSWLQSWPSPTTYSGARDSDYIEWSFAQAYNIRLICVVDGWAADLPTYRSTLPIGTASVYVTDEGLPPMVGSPRQSDICTSRRAGFQDYRS